MATSVCLRNWVAAWRSDVTLFSPPPRGTARRPGQITYGTLRALGSGELCLCLVQQSESERGRRLRGLRGRPDRGLPHAVISRGLARAPTLLASGPLHFEES